MRGGGREEGEGEGRGREREGEEGEGGRGREGCKPEKGCCGAWTKVPPSDSVPLLSLSFTLRQDSHDADRSRGELNGWGGVEGGQSEPLADAAGMGRRRQHYKLIDWNV